LPRACSAAEPGEFRGLVGLGEMAEDDPGGAPPCVVPSWRNSAGSVIGEVADAGEHSLLGPDQGYGAVAEHLEVVWSGLQQAGRRFVSGADLNVRRGM